MGDVRLKAQGQHLILIELVKLLRMAPKEPAGNDLLRGKIILLMIQTVHAPEVRDSALRGYARAAEKDNIPALADPFL